MSDNPKTPIRQELTEVAAELIDQHGLSLRGVAREIGVDHRSLSRWLRGATADTKIDEAMTSWCVAKQSPPARAGDDNAAGPVDWIETPTSEKILSALAYAQASRDMVVVVGAPGVGKTYAIKRYAAMYRDVWHATATPACTTVVPMLEEVAEAIGLREISAGARHLSRAIRARVRDTKGLLVVDEFQLLGLAALEQLRAIHDAEGIAIALVGNEVGFARMGGNQAARHAQICSRLGMRLHIRPPGPRDVHALAKRAGIDDAKCLSLLERIGARPGGLRSVTKVIRFAKSSGGAPTFQLLKAASDNLGADE